MISRSEKRVLVVSAALLLGTVALPGSAQQAGGADEAAQQQPTTAPAMPHMGLLSEEVVRARLTAAGYGEVRSIQREARHYRVETVRDGYPVQLSVDVQTGEIAEIRG